jgi:NTP pyrophosphatase (non-canonical NTP hydrolase)
MAGNMAEVKDLEDALIPIRMNHAIIGMMGELGELAQALEKWIYYGRELDRLNVIEELGDVLWYHALLCSAVETKLSDVMRANIRKLQIRYPDRYNDDSARVRDLEAERQSLCELADYCVHRYGPRRGNPGSYYKLCEKCGAVVSDD